MTPIHLMNPFSMMSQRMNWLSHGVSVVTQNVSNIHTPFYKARTLKELKFSSQTRQGSRTYDPSVLRCTHPRHLGCDGQKGKSGIQTQEEPNLMESITGNTVSLEHEMRKANEYGSRQKQLVNIIQSNMGMIDTASKVKES